MKDCPTPNGTTERTHFIPAFLEDNQIGIERDPGYEDRLMKRDPVIAKALRYGDWSVFAGQMFTEWNKGIHTIAPFEIPAHWTRWRGVDWGWAAPWSVHWFAKDPDTRRIFVYREIYKVGITDPQQARMINEISSNETFMFTFCDPSMWITDSSKNEITCKADTYRDNGVFPTRADHDHLNKISKLHSVLAKLPDGLPGMQIFTTCPALIRTIPALMRDPNKPEDLLDGQEEHAFDSLTYGLTNYRDPAPEPNRKPSQPWVSPMLKMKGL